MVDVPAYGEREGSAPTLNELPLMAARRAFLAPKLAAVLAQFRQIEAIDITYVEPALQMPERWDSDERE